MKVWKVSYIAKRKRTIYERQAVEVEFTQGDHEKTFGVLPDEGLDTMTLEQLAVEKGEAQLDQEMWEEYDVQTEMLNESSFEITEHERLERIFTVQLLKSVQDILEATVDVLAYDEKAAGEAAIAKACAEDSLVGWQYRYSVPYDENNGVVVISATREGGETKCADTDQA